MTFIARRHAASLNSRHFSLAAPGQPPYRVLFFGTDDVSLATLKALHASSNEENVGNRLIEHIEVVCPSDRPMNGRKKDEPVPVKRFAQRCGYKAYDTPSHLKSLKTWDFPATSHFDVGVVVSFGYFLHPHMLKNLHHGAINMHPSLLPKYRGPAPIHHALLNGDSTTGVSVIEIDPKAFDVGRILLQKHYDIKPGIQCHDLAKELASFGADCIVKTLGDLPMLKKTAVTQDDAVACKAPKLTFKDGLISLNEAASDIFHRWQALSSSVGVKVQFRGKVVKLIEVRLPTAEELQSVEADEDRNGPAEAGTFFFEKKRQALWLRCADASWLLVTKLQQADRKVGAALDFCNGYRLKNMQRERFESVFTGPVSSKL
ncbi:Formyl transferase C-terminal domain-containing protein [Phytophthora infestans]|uniref:Methionyl-tRNA formyltransferase, mitochondrial n=1 Tax=Phytophthora infestans TaxID=4787 RepID=A0A8S9UUA3_PHYIN|nr:Formyl transferase C-terminal domain-containing protein [Phytophthora infestans]